MLVLLVIFMVTAPLITPGEIQLPSVGEKTTVPAAALHVVVRKDGRLSLRDERPNSRAENLASAERLVDAVRQRQEARPGQAVVIEADENVQYRDVIKVLDALKRSGVDKVGLLVQGVQK